jgi:HTH-type transcriptional regulator, transcriptional repressor of NAD biosynthesis genes
MTFYLLCCSQHTGINIAMYAGVAYGADNISINVLTMWCFFFCNAVFGLYYWLQSSTGISSSSSSSSCSSTHQDKVGLCIGKFYPPHKGHQYLIDTARQQCAHVHIILCGRKGEEPPAELRTQWLHTLYPHKTVSILRIEDVYDPDDSQLWAALCKQWLGLVPDAVFTSEHYGDPWAKHLGSKHVLVDLAREAYPVQGTLVRQSPLQYWDMLSPCVQAHYAQRVVIIGAESTGKSTLAAKLAADFSAPLVAEYGRTYCEQFPDIHTKQWRTADFEAIVHGQARAEATAASSGSKLIICDTDCWTTTVWHTRYCGARSAALEELALQCTSSSSQQRALYLLCDVQGAPFVQDGTREEAVKLCPVAAGSGQTVRQWMHEQLLEHTRSAGLNAVLLQGDWQERYAQARAAVERLDPVFKGHAAGSS